MKPKPLKKQEVLSGSSARYEICPIGLGFNIVGGRPSSRSLYELFQPNNGGHVNVI